jgi:CRISPR-associated protein Csb2
MSTRALFITVRFLDGRYHGNGSWPPSPFRLFQALVAGAYGGRWVAEPPEDKDKALTWLERLPAPAIAAPSAERVRGVALFVPNNDLDMVGGDPARIAEIRGSQKTFASHLFDAERPFLYAWASDEDERHALFICRLAERLHTLGWGIDPAYARGEVVSSAEGEQRLRDYGGSVSTPGAARSRNLRACPAAGSLRSLHDRYKKSGNRFVSRKEGRTVRTTFRKPPHAHFRMVAYLPTGAAALRHCPGRRQRAVPPRDARERGCAARPGRSGYAANRSFPRPATDHRTHRHWPRRQRGG